MLVFVIIFHFYTSPCSLPLTHTRLTHTHTLLFAVAATCSCNWSFGFYCFGHFLAVQIVEVLMSVMINYPFLLSHVLLAIDKPLSVKMLLYMISEELG